jgi:hypothetical protein
MLNNIKVLVIENNVYMYMRGGWRGANSTLASESVMQAHIVGLIHQGYRLTTEGIICRIIKEA